MASSSSSHLPPSAYNPRRHVGVHAERISDVASTEFPGHYPGEDHSWSLARFKEVSTSREYFSPPSRSPDRTRLQNLKVSVKRLSQRSIEFDLVGVDASIANAFRRILIAEVC